MTKEEAIKFRENWNKCLNESGSLIVNNQKDIKLPTWIQVSKKVDNKEMLTKLEQYIFDYDIADKGVSKKWRKDLSELFNWLEL